MFNNISVDVNNSDIYLVFSYHPFSKEEIKKDKKYILKWLGSIIVRVMTLSQFSHVDYVSNLKDENGNNFVLGSIPDSGLGYRSQNNNSYYELYKHKTETIYEKPSFLNFIENKQGSAYDWTAIVGFGVPNRNWNETNKWFCSEIVAAAFNTIGHNIGKFSHRVSPVDLLRYPKLLERVYHEEI